MTIERIVSHRLADIVEAIERIHKLLDGVNLELSNMTGKSVGSLSVALKSFFEASRRLTQDIKTRQAHIPWGKVAGIGNVLRHAYDHVAPDVLWKLAQDDLPELEKACRIELEAAELREGC